MDYLTISIKNKNTFMPKPMFYTQLKSYRRFFYKKTLLMTYSKTFVLILRLLLRIHYIISHNEFVLYPIFNILIQNKYMNSTTIKKSKCTKRGSNPRIVTIVGLKSTALDHSAIRALYASSYIYFIKLYAGWNYYPSHTKYTLCI